MRTQENRSKSEKSLRWLVCVHMYPTTYQMSNLSTLRKVTVSTWPYISPSLVSTILVISSDGERYLIHCHLCSKISTFKFFCLTSSPPMQNDWFSKLSSKDKCSYHLIMADQRRSSKALSILFSTWVLGSEFPCFVSAHVSAKWLTLIETVLSKR